MNIRRVAVPLLTVVLLAGSGWSVAAGSRDPAGSAPPSMHGQSMMMGGQMMGNHMMGSAGMNGCSMTMGQLPPGNEKLEMQMHGEMMKAMGDIMLRYADRIQTPSSK